jgi:hypothetical protein
MMSESPTLKPDCAQAMEAMERDALELPGPVAAHLESCLPCSEARVFLLAMEEAPAVEAPDGYFEGLRFRMLRKLPGRRAGFGRPAALWLAAAGLIAGLGLGATGYFMGQAAHAPMVEAAQPKGLADTLDQPVETPFYEAEDPVTQLSELSAPEAEKALKRMQATPPARSGN